MVDNTGIMATSSSVQIGSQMKWSHPQENFFLHATRSAHRYTKGFYMGWKSRESLIIRWSNPVYVFWHDDYHSWF